MRSRAVDIDGAVDRLPELLPQADAREALAATGTDNGAGFEPIVSDAVRCEHADECNILPINALDDSGGGLTIRRSGVRVASPVFTTVSASVPEDAPNPFLSSFGCFCDELTCDPAIAPVSARFRTDSGSALGKWWERSSFMRPSGIPISQAFPDGLSVESDESRLSKSPSVQVAGCLRLEVFRNQKPGTQGGSRVAEAFAPTSSLARLWFGAFPLALLP
jgi:hypothetical protein